MLALQLPHQLTLHGGLKLAAYPVSCPNRFRLCLNGVFEMLLLKAEDAKTHALT